jgi:hypothetical protein
MGALSCGCWSCSHPDQDNAGLRVLHTERHIEFAELLESREPERMIPRSVAMLFETVPVGVCRLRIHLGHPAHPASHR